MKSFIITIDTEGDNLWDVRPQKTYDIRTENARFLPRFQELCNRYAFPPVYLTNYEMAMDSFFVEYMKPVQEADKCEIGMHLHAWNMPPVFDELPRRVDEKIGLPYLIEYPEMVMRDKITVMTSLLTERFGMSPISHRAGRWTMNQTYFRLLQEAGYAFDCSVTAGISWEKDYGYSPNSHGVDYTQAPQKPYTVAGTMLMEYPVTVLRSRKLFIPDTAQPKDLVRAAKRAVFGQNLWLRPNGKNLKECLYLLEKTMQSPEEDYIMFMLHSSEMMPGGSPTFRTEADVERLYVHMGKIFSAARERGYEGKTFRDIFIGMDNCPSVETVGERNLS